MANYTIVDCDPGTDDLSNLCLTLTTHDDIIAIVTSYGCSTLLNAHRNAHLILSLLGRTDIPLIAGASRPLLQHPIFGSQLPTFFGSNGISDVPYPTNFGSLALPDSTDEGALEEIASKLTTCEPASVTYVVSGPCTTLARLLSFDSALVNSRVREIIVMGGAIELPGNTGIPTSPNGVKKAEFNVYIDVRAFNQVIESCIPVTLISWDEARKFLFTLKQVEKLDSDLPSSKFLIQAYKNFFKLYGKVHFCDDASDPYMTQIDVVTTLYRLGLGTLSPMTLTASENLSSYGEILRGGKTTVNVFFLDKSARPTEYFLNALQISER